MRVQVGKRLLILASLGFAALLVLPPVAGSSKAAVVTGLGVGGYLMTAQSNGGPTNIQMVESTVTVPDIVCGRGSSGSAYYVATGLGLYTEYEEVYLLLECNFIVPGPSYWLVIDGRLSSVVPAPRDVVTLIATPSYEEVIDRTQHLSQSLGVSSLLGDTASCAAFAPPGANFGTIYVQSCKATVGGITKAIGAFGSRGALTESVAFDNCASPAVQLLQVGPLTRSSGGFVIVNLHSPAPICD